MLNKDLDYEKHQRDYSILGASIVIQGLFNENKKFFNCSPNPFYLILKEDTFYHFMPKKDALLRHENLYKHLDLNKLKKIESQYSQKKKEFELFYNKKHSNNLNALQELIKYFVNFSNIIMIGYEAPEHHQNKDVRDFAFTIRKKYENVHKQCFTLERNLLPKVEQELDLEKDTLFYLTIDEFNNFLKTGIIPDISPRKKFILIKHSGQGEEIFYNPELIKHFFDDVKNIKEIKGQSAYPGKVEGPVKIITKVDQAKNITEGDILVASMTDPRYLPAMKRAAAIITDEGGITCHAAIVARELKKPCIVATKIATQALKDGDKVEINADKGIIKIIK